MTRAPQARSMPARTAGTLPPVSPATMIVRTPLAVSGA
jgi:hypothetical protein